LARHVLQEFVQSYHRERETQHSEPLGGVEGGDLEHCLLRWNKGKEGRGGGGREGKGKPQRRRKRENKRISEFS
jgi:hypothetical protein